MTILFLGKDNIYVKDIFLFVLDTSPLIYVLQQFLGHKKVLKSEEAKKGIVD